MEFPRNTGGISQRVHVSFDDVTPDESRAIGSLLGAGSDGDHRYFMSSMVEFDEPTGKLYVDVKANDSVPRHAEEIIQDVVVAVKALRAITRPAA